MANFLTRMISGGGGGNYAYVTARVRAKKNQLLGADQYPKLLARDASDIARTLQEGQYKAEIDELAARYRGAELVERATRLNLGRVYGQIVGFATGELQMTIAAYLARYDVYNVKTVLRGKFSNAKPENILDETIPAGILAPRLAELARLDRIEDVVDALRGTPFHRVLVKHTEGKQLTNLIEIENDLDRAFYEILLESVSGSGRANKAFLSWIRNEIDVMNLKTLFRLRFARVTEWEAYFLPGGTDVSRESASRIVRGTDDEVVAEVGQLDVDQSVVEAARQSLASGNLNAIATALDKELVRDAADFSHRAPLSVLPVVELHPAQEDRSRQPARHRVRQADRPLHRDDRGAAGTMSKDIGVMGTSDFVLGFNLAGIRKTYAVDDKADFARKMERLLAQKDNLGILVVESSHFESLQGNLRRKVSESLEPVVIAMGEGAGEADLREKVKRAIGIDLYK